MDIIYLFLHVEIRTLEDLKRNDGKNMWLNPKLDADFYLQRCFLP